MKLTPEQLKQFDEEGYLFFPDYFSPQETAILKSEIPGVFQQRREENVRDIPERGEVGPEDDAASRPVRVQRPHRGSCSLQRVRHRSRRAHVGRCCASKPARSAGLTQ